MKKLLLTTAVLAFSDLVSIGQAYANSDSSLNKINYALVYKSINITIKADNMQNGDFMSIADAMSRADLYTGYGSAKMFSTRLQRY